MKNAATPFVKAEDLMDFGMAPDVVSDALGSHGQARRWNPALKSRKRAEAIRSPQPDPQLRGHSSLSYEGFFSEAAILDALCAWRVKEASKRGNEMFFHRICPDSTAKEKSEHEHMFPPRRLWHRYRPRAHEGRTAAELNRIALKRAIRTHWRHQPEPAWLVELKRFVGYVRERGLSSSAAGFRSPKIIGVPKKRGHPQNRAIAVFESLEDRLVDGLVARYLRGYVEPALDAASYSFRAGKPGKPAPTHHDAARNILAYRASHRDGSLYVAECDIRSFYDCMDQNLARSALLEIERENRHRPDRGPLDPRALRQVDACLASYSFPVNVLGEEAPKLAAKRPGDYFPWPEDELRTFHERPGHARVGIPQGSAISAVLGNCLLDQVDRELRRLGNGDRFLYLRYCDDMVILSPSLRACRRAFETYRRCMRKLRLPVHSAVWPDRSVGALLKDLRRRSQRVPWGKLPLIRALRMFRKELRRPGLGGRYGKAFWKGKTREPYRWAPPVLWFRRSPWIQFVGYQFRWDGVVRIRKDSFVRHIQKVNQTLWRVLQGIDRAAPGQVGKSQGQIFHRLRMRLIAMAVGRREIRSSVKTPLPASWCGGFEALNGQPFVEGQLVALDRHRERQLDWFKRALVVRRDKIPMRMDLKTAEALKHYGRPFSYRGQFKMGELPGNSIPGSSAIH